MEHALKLLEEARLEIEEGFYELAHISLLGAIRIIQLEQKELDRQARNEELLHTL